MPSSRNRTNFYTNDFNIEESLEEFNDVDKISILISKRIKIEENYNNSEKDEIQLEEIENELKELGWD